MKTLLVTAGVAILISAAAGRAEKVAIDGTVIGMTKSDAIQSHSRYSVCARGKTKLDSQTYLIQSWPVTNKPSRSRAYYRPRIVIETIKKTLHFNIEGRLVAITITFENIDCKKKDEILKALERKYSREMHKSRYERNYYVSSNIKLATTVSVKSHRHSPRGKPIEDRFTIKNFYFDIAKYPAALAELDTKVEMNRLL